MSHHLPTILFALRHPAEGNVTAVEGFLHPIFGLDHLLAMITVGLLSAQMGGRAIWTVPGAFVAAMLVGGVAGMAGSPMPAIEYGVSASLIALGLALAVNRRMPEAAAMLFVFTFGLFHGYAHGAEIDKVLRLMDKATYVLGFIVATAGLHVVGALIGYTAVRTAAGARGLRAAGLVLAVIGVYLVTSL